jgi:hypothetical protein
MAHDGLARAMVPAHTPADGDTIFALATAAGGEADGPYLPTAIATPAAPPSVATSVRLWRRNQVPSVERTFLAMRFTTHQVRRPV